jgi:HSP20 family protein
LEEGVLAVSGVRNADELGENTDVRRAERLTGRFSRRFTLPETTDADRVTAKIRNGILEVVIPKLPEVQPRRITVEAA